MSERESALTTAITGAWRVPPQITKTGVDAGTRKSIFLFCSIGLRMARYQFSIPVRAPSWAQASW